MRPRLLIPSGVWGQSPHLGIVKGGALNEVFFRHSFADTKEWRRREKGSSPNDPLSLHNISYENYLKGMN